MSSHRYKPSKPMALFGAVFGAAILIFGLVTMLRGDLDGTGVAFLILWCVAGIGIIGFNLWAAFSEKGSLATFQRVPDDEEGRSDEPR